LHRRMLGFEKNWGHVGTDPGQSRVCPQTNTYSSYLFILGGRGYLTEYEHKKATPLSKWRGISLLFKVNSVLE
jgi:hypothetical protein